jgi:transglutaminase-like putative cysteine protease
MKTARRLLYFASFVGLALTAAAVIARIGRPSIASLLVATVVVASVAGAPGLVHRRAWPVALVLLPLGGYLLLRAQAPIPSHVHGLGGQAGFLFDQMRAGAKAYQSRQFPLEFATATHVGLLLSLVVYGAVWLAAFLALSLRRPLPALVILLAVLGFGFTTDNTARIVWSPVAFLVLSGCLLASSRSLEREHWRARDTLAGGAAAMIAAVLALLLLATTSVAASRPWQDWTTWGIAGPDNSRVSFDWMENFPRLLDPAANAVVMRVRSPLASYWRANALSRFDGTSWSTGASYDERYATAWSAPPFTYQVPLTSHKPTGTLVTESFHLESMSTDYLFTGGFPRSLFIGRQLSLRVPDTLALGVDPPLGPHVDYTITAVIPRVKPTDLLARGRNYPSDLLQHYTLLPFASRAAYAGPSAESDWSASVGDSPDLREWLGLYKLNQDIVGTATDPHTIALKVQDYLRSHYVYSLRPPHSDDRSPYAAFLFQTRIGYCQQFAGAMAVLMRFNGVPARVAVGFATGKRDKSGTFVVMRTDAHAWVELYFPGVGWVPFDPTPGWTIPSPGAWYANPASGDPSASGGPGNAGGSAGASSNPQSLGKNRGASGASGGHRASAGRSWTAGWLPPCAVLVAVLVAWPVGRAARRRRGLRRGGTDARLRAALTLVYVDLADNGIDVPRSQTLDETARFLKSDLDLDARELVDRVQAVLFGGRAATQKDVDDAAALRRELKRRLRARRGRLRSLLVLYGLRDTSPAKA